MRNSGVNKREVYAVLFSLLRVKIFKGLVPLIYGESNAGKTTLIKPFKNYYPKDKIGTLSSTLSEYYINDVCV